MTNYLTLILLLLLFNTSTALALNINSSSLQGLSRTYGFLIGQDYYLSQIEQKFPELKSSVDLARLNFSSAFPKIESKLKIVLKDEFGENNFQALETNLNAEITKNFNKRKIIKEEAVAFIEKVTDRSKGNIESPVLEYLLAVKYESNLVGEFLDGYKQQYQTDGSGKAQGIKLKIKIPSSWREKEGERPHILRKWVNENGTGLSMILLEIRDADGYNPSKNEVERFVTSGEIMTMLPEGAKFVASGKFNIEMQTGFWIEMSMLAERAEVEILQNILRYQFFFNGKAIALSCHTAGTKENKKNVEDVFKRTRPLCQQVLNSLVLPQVY
jgi:hypothetical protein